VRDAAELLPDRHHGGIIISPNAGHARRAHEQLHRIALPVRVDQLLGPHAEVGAERGVGVVRR